MTLTLTTQPVNAVQKLKATGNLTLDLGEAVVFVDDAVDWSTFFSPNSCDKYGFVLIPLLKQHQVTWPQVVQVMLIM
jgi:hypothetical protein